MNNPFYLGLSILEISKKLYYKQFWKDHIKTKYQQNMKLCYIDIDSSIIYVKTEDIYKDILNNIKKIFDTSNYDINRLLPMEKKVV